MINNNTTDQIYENGILLGALLQITGLSIYEVQAIIRGEMVLKTSGKDIRNLIIEGFEFKQPFCVKINQYGISLEDLNSIFNCQITQEVYNQNISNLKFYFNQWNFSAKISLSTRINLVNLFKEKYNLNNNQIAKILDISPTTVQKDLNTKK